MKSSPKVTKQITVFVALVVHGGKILLVQRDEPEVKGAHMKWEIPGGKVDFSETPEQAIVREIKEETGVKVKIKRLLPTVFNHNWDYPWGIQHTLIFCYECIYVSETKRKKDHHVAAVEWVNISEVKNRDRLPGVDFFIDALIA